jgi:hypothetical protein
VRGLSAAGLPLARISYEHELCFRCHADSLDRGLPLVNRQHVQTNTRLEFSPANPSYHPVLAAGASTDVPSLISPLTVASTIACTDCHNNDSATGARGPHGSVYRPILERQLVLTHGSTDDQMANSLCYKCHDRGTLRGDGPGDVSFSEHQKHVEELPAATGGPASCAACHDPHGVQAAAANASHLINLDLDYVSPSGSGQLKYEDLGNRTGQCYLTCHGEDHDPYIYPR